MRAIVLKFDHWPLSYLGCYGNTWIETPNLDRLAAQLLAACDAAATGSAISLQVAPLAHEPPLLVAEVLRAIWRSAGWPEQAMTHHWWRALAALAQSPTTAPALNLPGNLLARRTGDRLLLAPASSAG